MSLQIMNPYARESRMRRSEIPMSMMRRRNRCRCRCICGCRRTPGSRRVECGRCGHPLCPGYCLAVELSGRALCRHCLSTNCNGVPEPWQFMEIVELRFYHRMRIIWWMYMRSFFDRQMSSICKVTFNHYSRWKHALFALFFLTYMKA